jgi:hypothetical protein
MDGFPPSNWIIKPMGAELIPLYAAWAAKIDPEKQLDLNLIVGIFKGEMDLAISSQSIEYLMGIYNEDPVFFINGHLTDAKGYDSVKNEMGQDYNLNMFVDPGIMPRSDLYEQAWYQAANFLFNRHSIGRVIISIDKLLGLEKDTISKLGFKRMEQSQMSPSKYQYFVCSRNDFAPFMEL